MATRIERSAVLDNRIREAVFATVRDAPGVSIPALQRVTGASATTISYHLRVLERNGFVTCVVDGRRRRHFPTGLADRRTLQGLAVLQHPRTRECYELLRERPLDRLALERALGVTSTAILWHLDRLVRAGLVEVDRSRRVTVYLAVASVTA